MRQPSNLPKEALEILQTIEHIKGPIHARMVLSIFSMNNCFATALNHAELPSVVKEAMVLTWEGTIAQAIYCYADATLRQDPKWASYENEEKFDKAGRFMQSLQEDVETLDKKQKEYSS